MLVFINDYSEDGTKIYNGMSPTKIKEGKFKYGQEIFTFGFLQNILAKNMVMFEYVDSRMINWWPYIEDEIGVKDKKFIYLMELLGDPAGWLSNLLLGVSNLVIKEVRKGNGIIMLYGAYEGFEPFYTNIFESIDKKLTEWNIPFNNFVYVTANQIADKLYDEWCKENNKKNKFNIICFNDEECHVFWDSRINELPFSPEKYFLCFNRRPHVHRIFLASLLEKNNLVDKGIISFPDKTFSEGYPSMAELNQKLENLIDPNTQSHGWELIDGNEDTKKDMLHYWNKFEKRLPLTVDVDDLSPMLWESFNIEPYKKTFFSVVVEGLVYENSVFMDEKIWKVILAKHPFIVVGTSGVLSKLKEFGYKTFHPYINEEYDSIEDPGKRILAVVEEIKRLCTISFEEWNNIINELEPILDYNKKWKFERKGGIDNFVDKIGYLIDK